MVQKILLSMKWGYLPDNVALAVNNYISDKYQIWKIPNVERMAFR